MAQTKTEKLKKLILENIHWLAGLQLVLCMLVLFLLGSNALLVYGLVKTQNQVDKVVEYVTLKAHYDELVKEQGLREPNYEGMSYGEIIQTLSNRFKELDAEEADRVERLATRR